MKGRTTRLGRIAALAIGGAAAAIGIAALAGAGAQDADCPCGAACGCTDSGARISVVGEGEVSVDPNRAEISVGASFERTTAEAAQQAVNRVLAEVIDEIRDLDIEGTQIQTAGITLHPIYNRPRDGQPEVTGYRASNTVRVRVDDVQRVGEVLDVAVEHDANQGFGISFMLRNEERATQEALRQAVAQAKRKAQTMGEALGMKMLAIEEVVEMGAQRPQPVYRGVEMMDARMASAPTPVESGQITVRASVTLVARVGEEERDG